MNIHHTIPGYARVACGLFLISLVCGCFNSSTSVSVKKDGSGSVTETVLVTDVVAAWGGTNSAKDNLAAHMIRCRDRATAMGRGVALDTVEEVRTNGMTGFKAVYSFKDVRRLAVEQQPDLAILGKLMPEKVLKSSPVTFGLDTAASPTLTVNFPKAQAPATSPARVVIPQMSRSVLTDERAVIRSMFKNFRIQLSITVPGRIVSTKASHIAPDGNNTVVLLDLDIEKLLEADHQLDTLLPLGQVDDIDTARIRLSGIKCIKIEPSERLQIVFR